MSSREVLGKILSLCEDQSFSHAVRMLRIKALAAEALEDADIPAGKTSGGAKTRDKIQEPNTSAPGKVTL